MTNETSQSHVLSRGKRVILLTGGGSGGHIYPLSAVTEQFKKLISNHLIYYLGPVDVFSVTLATHYGVKMRKIATAKLDRFLSFRNIFLLPKFFWSLLQALFKVFWIMPEVIFSKGGPGALPVVLAGWFYRIPIVIHESDALPGLTNLISARFAKKIALSFEGSAGYFDPKKTFVTGNPVREELLGTRYSSEVAKDELHFNMQIPLTLVLGGSQGSKRINEFILANLGKLLKETQILHQTGSANYLEVKNLSRAAILELPLKEELEHRYQAVPYLDEDMKAALLAADLVVARAGSGTIFEIAAFGKPAILIPLKESANDHQRANAFEFARAGGGVVIEEENLLPGIFTSRLHEILGNQNEREKMAEAAVKFFQPGAAEAIAREVLKLAGA
ncbi:MAG: UDP-N-acetylglucosamine--N-acetylmuramyl-(pentapeptide) pyrophosphoryl-undecaprenol N-acetylglucosamine transferase [Candidatus Liptonbacteria bacterium]|nr:UDP-N-acetylglucosamine--N-acetylmuramyl-(pentapeptide) pyrophosphoryl-undecaprenol N-acetylglucosamine transferase [Candidatus Liptonbacteria bacterium]